MICEWCGEEYEVLEQAKDSDPLCNECWLISRFFDLLANRIEASERIAKVVINMLVAKGRIEDFTVPGDDDLTPVIFLPDLHVGATGQDYEIFTQYEEAITLVNEWMGY